MLLTLLAEPIIIMVIVQVHVLVILIPAMTVMTTPSVTPHKTKIVLDVIVMLLEMIIYMEQPQVPTQTAAVMKEPQMISTMEHLEQIQHIVVVVN